MSKQTNKFMVTDGISDELENFNIPYTSIELEELMKEIIRTI